MHNTYFGPYVHKSDLLWAIWSPRGTVKGLQSVQAMVRIQLNRTATELQHEIPTRLDRTATELRYEVQGVQPVRPCRFSGRYSSSGPSVPEITR